MTTVARGRRTPGRVTLGSKAVAVAILAEAIRNVEDDLSEGVELTPDVLAGGLVSLSWDVEYKPTAERLVLIIDAGITSSDKMRSTPEDHGHAETYGEVGPNDVVNPPAPQ